MITRLLSIALLLLVQVQAFSLGKQSLPIFQDSWLPSATTVIATFDGKQVTEQDLYLWQFISGGDPFIARDWREASINSTVRNKLEFAVEDYFKAKLLYPVASANLPEQEISVDRAAHLLATWPAAISYAEFAVRDTVQISENDLRYAYAQNNERFLTPPTMTFLRYDVSVTDGITLSEARNRAATLRREIQAGKTPEQLFQSYGNWLTPETKLQPLYENVPTNTLDDAAYGLLEKLLPNQVSAPQQRQRSLRLYKLISKSPASQIPFENVREQLTRELFPTQYRQQFALHLVKNKNERYPLNRVSYLQFMEPSMPILRMGDYELSTAEFLAYVAEFPNPEAPKDRKQKLEYRGEEILQGEGLIQELEERGQLVSSYYPTAFSLAQELIASNRYLNSSSDDLTEAELDAYIAANRDSLAPPFDYTVWAFSASIPTTFTGSANELAQAQRSLYQTQSDLIVRARQLLDERASIGTSAAYALPESVMNRLLRTADQAQYLTFKNIGGFTPAEAELSLGLLPSQLVIGQFSGPRQLGNEMVSYYVAETRPRPAPAVAVLRELARKKVNEEKRLGVVLNRIAEGKRSGALDYNLP